MRRLQAMELFASAVREGSFSAAGRHVGLSPASVSRQVAALEASLGIQLLAWFRIGRSWVTRTHEERRPVRAGCRRAMSPVREAAGLPSRQARRG